MMDETDVSYGRRILALEADAVRGQIDRLGPSFEAAVQAVLACRGRVVLTGIGKPGIVAQKVSATLASTGTPSFFLHSAEAVHGDLGRIAREDVVIVLSNSGRSEEVVRLLPCLKRIGPRLVVITGDASSPLAQHSDLLLDIGRIEEACPLGLAPSASTLAMMALGDALALAVLRHRSFDVESYAELHPAGELGRRLLKVGEIMRTGERNPTVAESVPVREAAMAITQARAGAATVVGPDGRLTGIFTDGDLRRNLAPELIERPIGSVMTRRPITVGPDLLAMEALRILREKKIDEVPVVDGGGRPVGMLDVQDLMGAGLV